MDTSKQHYVFNLTLFKTIGFYQMVDPNTKKAFGFNVYNLINITFVIFISIMTIIGLLGFIYKPADTITHTNNSFKNILFMSFYVICMVIGNLKIVIIVYNANAIWKLFKVAHESFLSNEDCKRSKYKLENSGKQFSIIFIGYCSIFILIPIAWSTVPFVMSNQGASDETQGNENIYRNNIINLRYPITAKTYNTFYKSFYVLEFIMTWYSAYGLVIFDVFIFALLKLMAIHYEIISSAYETFKSNARKENGKLTNTEIREELVSIILDCQTIYKQLETLYRISRPILLFYLVGDAVGMITMPYLIVMSYVQYGSIFNIDGLSSVLTLFSVGIQAYLNCSLLQDVNEKKENVNFGLYSSDWTWLDIKIKKLILLAMRMNSSNNLQMNVTSTKFIDLPMFASIIRSSYSVTSVLINSNINEIKKK